jgi:hypothetical protein
MKAVAFPQTAEYATKRLRGLPASEDPVVLTNLSPDWRRQLYDAASKISKGKLVEKPVA